MIPNWIILISITLSLFNFFIMWKVLNDVSDLKEENKK